MGPRSAETAQPCVDLGQRARIDGVDAPRAFGAHRREPALSQHLQLLRDRRLGDAELPRDDFDDLAGGVLTLGEELQDPAPNGIAEDVERMHQVPV